MGNNTKNTNKKDFLAYVDKIVELNPNIHYAYWGMTTKKIGEYQKFRVELVDTDFKVMFKIIIMVHHPVPPKFKRFTDVNGFIVSPRLYKKTK